MCREYKMSTTSCSILAFSLSVFIGAQASAEESSDTFDNSIELAVWNSPTFKRDFAQSYLAETDVEPTVDTGEREILIEAQDLMAQDKPDEAIELLKSERDEKSTAAIDYMLGGLYVQRDDLDDAIKVYAEAVGKFPNYRRAWKQLGITRIRSQDYAGGAEALTRAFQLGSIDALTTGVLGIAYSNTGEWLAAESAYRRAIMLDPATREWRMGLARSFFGQERFQEAAALLKEEIQRNPANTKLWMLQANAYLGMKDAETAAENYEIIDVLGGSTEASLAMLANIYVNEGLFDLAVDNYIKSLELTSSANPSSAITATELMVRRSQLDSAERLISYLDEHCADEMAVEQVTKIRKLQARIAVAQGESDKQVEILEELVNLNPLDGEALILLGRHFVGQGDVERGIAWFERAAMVEGYEADAMLRHGQALVQQGRYQEAIPLLRASLEFESRETVQQYLEQVERVAQGR